MTLYLKASGYLQTGVDVDEVTIDLQARTVTYTDVEGNTFVEPIDRFKIESLKVVQS